MNKKSYTSLIFTFCFLLFNAIEGNAQVHSATSAHTTFTNHSMTGYQGWFGAPDDGGNRGWRHYNGDNGFQPGSASIEYWPDMRETDKDEKYPTSFVKSDGSPCYVFSSVHPKTVSRHFQWMKEYGIDGAFMQRFRSDFGLIPTMNIILANGLNAANEHGRAISLMYDIGANIHVDGVPNDAKRTEEVNMIFNDWKSLIDNLNLTTGGNDQAYLYHNGEPLIVLWGVGFNHRHTTTGLDVQYWVELVDSLQNSPEYGGCSVMLGVPTNWRLGGGDCISGDEHTKMLELIKTIDIVQPWHTSRYRRSQMSTDFKSIVTSDISWCNFYGVDYTPTVSPGIREKILHDNDYEKPREGGYYFWDMAKAAIEAGTKLLYLGMYDEVDEGTQYHKIDNNPPFFSNDQNFATYGNDPEDHYLWLAGEATRALRGEFTMGATFRQRADDSDFQSEIKFVDNGTSYTLELSSPAANRKVFYANPYSVPDGAPTIGTVRNNDLFINELTSEVVILTEEQRGKFIRFVEVDATSDEIISFKAVVALADYTQIPYSTSFEEGVIDRNMWTVRTENSAGRINVTTDNVPNIGNFHLTFGADGSGTSSVNQADLHLNLERINTDILLQFSFKHLGDAYSEENGIYFSNNGGQSFSQVCNFETMSNLYADTTLNITELAWITGLELSDQFVIRFQHASDKLVSNGGLAIDDVSIINSTIKSGFAQFISIDDTTQGNWIGRYGINGQEIAGKESKLPDFANLFFDFNSEVIIWEDNSSDVRGLSYTPDSTVLSARYASYENHPWWFSLDVGERESEVSVYFLDGDNQNRQFILSVVDNATGDKYDIQTIKEFGDGKWLTWKIKGKVKFVMEALEGSTAVVSGIFINPSSPTEIVIEHSLTFDGVNDFVNLGNGNALKINGTEITLEAWFKTKVIKDQTWQSTILAMDHGEEGNDVGYFLRANGDGNINWGLGDGSWHEVHSDEGLQLFELGTWNHIAGSYDGAVLKVYLNGNLIGTSDTIKTTIGVAPVESLYLGSSPSWPGRVLNGSLAEVRIWNIARTGTEIKEFATKRITGNENGLAGYWPINEGEGQIITDHSSNNNDGILGGTSEETDTDPVWTKSNPIILLIDALEGFNGSFEDGLTNWRFFEVPNSIGSTAEIINGDVINGANALKITYMEPDANLGDRALDNWDSNMTLNPGAEYLAKFWAKTETPDNGVLKIGYGFFNSSRGIISEGGTSFELSNIYTEYEFSFTAPEATETGWLALRWKDNENNNIPGVIFLDHIQLWTPDAIFVKSITISGQNWISIGGNLQLTASILPGDATYTDVQWSVSPEDAAIASIDNQGVVTGLAQGTATILATAIDGSEISAALEVSIVPVGINEVNSMQISIFPNPVQSTLNIRTNKDQCTYSIVSVLGRTIKNGEINGDTILNVSDLKNGMYFIQVTSKNTRKVIPFIKE